MENLSSILGNNQWWIYEVAEGAIATHIGYEYTLDKTGF